MDRYARRWWLGFGIAALVAVLLAWGSIRARSTSSVAQSVADPTNLAAASGDEPTTEPAPTRRTLDDPQTLGRTAVVGGTVRDPDGKPIAGAEVCAFAGVGATGERVPTCARAGADGRYQLPTTTRVIVLSATAAGFLPSVAPVGHRANRLALASGEQRAGVDFVLTRGGAPLVGIVSDVFGGPIEGALVIASHPDSTDQLDSVDPRVVPVHATTDADGRFEVSVASGPYVVRASALGYARGITSTLVPGPTVQLALAPEGAISGIVVDAAGAPVPGARIHVRSWHGSHAVDRAVGVADDAGRFRIAGLGPGRYRPSAAFDERVGMAERSYAIDIGESVDDVRIELIDAASLTATVLASADESPCPGGQVVIADPSRDESIRAAIGDGGVAVFEGVLPGTYDVAVRCDDHASTAVPRQLVVAPGPNDVVWHVDGGNTLRGRVLDHLGEPTVAFVAVLAADGGGDGVFRPTKAGDDGAFVIPGVPAGPHTVRAELDGGQTTSVTVDVGPSTPELELRLGTSTTLRGTIRRGREGAPGLEIRATPTGGDAWHNGMATTDDDGKFVIEGLPPGPHTVAVADRMETELARKEIDIPERGATFDLALPEAATIRGVVLDDGVPLPDVAVAAIDGSKLGHVDARVGALREASGARSVLTDADGRFTIEGVDATRSYTVLAQRRGGGQASADGVRPGKSVTLVMQPMGEVTGEVTGGAVVGLAVALRRTDGAPALRDSFPIGGSHFAFDGVPPGSYDVVAVARGGRGRAKVDVVGGKRSRVAIVLEPNRNFRGRFVDVRTGEPVPNVYAIFGEEDATFTELAMKAELAIATRATGIVSGPDGVFSVPDVPSHTARLLAFSSDIGSGTPSILTFVTIAAGAESPTPVDVPLGRGRKKGEPGAAVGFAVELETFCSDTPRVAKIIDTAVAHGLAVGDEIVAVDGIDVTNLRCYLARELLAVEPGGRVELTLEGERKVVLVAPPAG
ncbi:MAG: carboxypeptidase regulatory-like domain-containing protein [Nannocystaceae bacterium]|nr:carboxypeptidase regulatory-like domain-containing protein [Nannocystaceae bacterium]